MNGSVTISGRASPSRAISAGNSPSAPPPIDKSRGVVIRAAIAPSSTCRGSIAIGSTRRSLAISLGIEAMQIDAVRRQIAKAAAPVERSGIAGHQEPEPQPIKRLVIENRLDQEFPQTGIAMPVDDENIRQVGKGRRVGDGTGKADLLALAVKPKA